jgi:monoamine oxidase
MARTPLMELVLRSLHTARGAAARGMPVSEYDEQLREQRSRFSRRRFLQLSAGAAGAAVLSGCPDPVERDVVIVGGGIAGLHCAYRLRRLGVATQIYDASSRIGGRIFSLRDYFPEGQSCELGGELIDSVHMTMHDLAEELGIELFDYEQDDASLARIVASIDGRLLSSGKILQGFGPIAEKIDTALSSMIDPELVPTYRNTNGAEALDQLSIRGWMDQVGIEREDPVRQLIEVAYTGEFGLELDDCNVLNLLTYISTSTIQFEMFGQSDERFRAKAGNDIFVQRLTEQLDPAQFHLEQRLVRLEELPDGRYALTFEGAGGPREVKASHVVLALPFTMLRQVELLVDLPERKRRAIAELGFGAGAKMMVGFSSRPWRSQHGSDGSTYTDTGYMQTWEASRLQPGASGILTNFTGGKRGVAIGEGTPEQQASNFLEELNRVFPGVSKAYNGRVARMHWPSYPLTLGSYAAYRVGQYTTIAGAEIERVGNLHFCGEHTSLDAQGYMEGGALTGALAATELAEELALPVELRMGPSGRITSRARAVRRHGRWLDGMRQQMPRRRRIVGAIR